MIIIAHDRDVDGIGSHAIMQRYCDKKGLTTKHLFVDYVDFCKKLGEIGDVTGEEIVIADLGYSDMLSSCITNLEALGEENTIRWFDHHDWSGVKAPQDIEMNIDMTKCGAELVANAYLPKDEVALRIASLARAQDFMGKDELAWKLYDVISAGFEKLRLTELLASGVYWNEQVNACYDDYQAKRKIGFAYLDEHSKLYNIGAFTGLLGFSKPFLSSTIATGHLLEKNPDFAICIWPSGKMSFRRNNPSVALRKIAGIFGGGGRDQAAGGHFGRGVTEANYVQAFDEIAKKVSQGTTRTGGA